MTILVVSQYLLFTSNCFRNLAGFILFCLSSSSSESSDFHHFTAPAPPTSWTSRPPQQTLEKHGSPLSSHLLTSLWFNHHISMPTHRCTQWTRRFFFQDFLPPFSLKETKLLYIWKYDPVVQAAQKSSVNIVFIISNFALKSKDKSQRIRDYTDSIVSYLPRFFIKVHTFMIISFIALFPLSQLVYCHETTV